jgi:hypothetical protein
MPMLLRPIIPAWFYLLLALALVRATSQTQTSTELSAEPLVNVLSLLNHRDSKQRLAAFRELDRRKDARVVPGLIELLRVRKPEPDSYIEILLRKFTGKNLGPHWMPWSEWLTAHPQVELPPQFREWKATLFGLLDPAFSRLLAAEQPLRIRSEEIVWGGVKKDGIPALTNPKLIAAAQADYLHNKDLVFGVELNGDARAYPLRLLDWHEMVNDVVAGQAVSLAYCTLCRSGILFETTVGDRVFTFGSSGLLYRSNKLMYDHQTESLWLTIPGEPASGALAHSGIKLKKLPLVVTTWQAWRAQHPATQVLSLATGFQRDYSKHEHYAAYFASPDLMFPVPRLDARLPAKEEVFALVVNGAAKAYALRKLRSQRLLNDQLGGQALVLVTEEQTGATRAYARAMQTFQPHKTARQRLHASDGSEWLITEAALVHAASGAQLPRLPGHQAYWFGWTSFYPDTLLYR